MLGIRLFTLVAGLFNQNLRSRQGETQLRRELLAHQRRQLLHRHIPDVYAAQAAFGPRFDELRALLVAHDPGRLGTDAAGSPLYEELARTLLYQLPAATSEAVAALLQQEVSLWFGHRAATAAALPALAQAVGEWQRQRLPAKT